MGLKIIALTGFTVQDLEILIATMDRVDLGFLESMFSMPVSQIPLSLLVVNQSNTTTLKSVYPNIKVVNSDTYGLSKSRNIGLRESSKPLLLITDDDVVFKPNFASNVVVYFNNYPTAQVVLHKVIEGTVMRTYPEIGRITDRDGLSGVGSIEISLKRNCLDLFELEFDEHLGLGTNLPLAEETLFIYQLFDKGAILHQSDATITTHEHISSGKRFIEEGVVEARAVLNHLVGKWPDWLWSLKYALWLSKNGYMNLVEAPTIMRRARRGISSYRQSKRLQ
ncbi:MAG: glycosyltransferase family A protein [Nonlabens sp.]